MKTIFLRFEILALLLVSVASARGQATDPFPNLDHEMRSPRAFYSFQGKAEQFAEEGKYTRLILDKISSVSREAPRSALFKKVLDEMCENDPVAVAEWVSEDPVSRFLLLGSDEVEELSVAKPDTMIEIAKRMYSRSEPGSRDQQLLEREKTIVANALPNMAKTNPEAALRELDHWSEHRTLFGRVLGEVTQEWGAKDFSSAKEFVKTLELDDGSDDVVQAAMLRNVDEKEMAGGLTLAKVEQSAVVLLDKIAKAGPGSAANWIADNCRDRATLCWATEEVAGVWARTAFDDATGWVKSLPEGEQRNRACIAMIRSAVSPQRIEGNADGVEFSEAWSLQELFADKKNDLLQFELLRVLRKWHGVDPEAAKLAYAGQSELAGLYDQQAKAVLFGVKSTWGGRALYEATGRLK